jgi:putative GTP pyrophosphokinase
MDIKEYLNDKNFITKSECGISLINAKLQIISDDLSMRYGRKVIYNKTDRIKSYDSLSAKLIRKGLEENMDIVHERIHDLIGVRAVCAYTDELYEIADLICSQKDIKLIKIKDYIKNPKASGYRSLHLIIEVPICFQDGEQWIKIEIQLRTVAMDYWAGLDTQLQYKKGKAKADIIGEELKKYALVIEKMENKVLELRKRVEAI